MTMPNQAFIDAYEAPKPAPYGTRLDLREPVRMDDALRELRVGAKKTSNADERAEVLVDLIEHASPRILVRTPRPSAPHPEEFEDEPANDGPSDQKTVRGQRRPELGPVPAFLRMQCSPKVEPVSTIRIAEIDDCGELDDLPLDPTAETAPAIAAAIAAKGPEKPSRADRGADQADRELNEDDSSEPFIPESVEPESGELDASRESEPEPIAPEQSDDTSAASELLPMYQVDHFAWPETCDLFERRAGRQMDVLSEAVEALIFSGTRHLGFASYRRGEGCTTLLAGAARRLAAHGRKVALVDGDLSNPRLADCLGLAVEAGWEKVVARECRLEEVLIESVEDGGLTLLPWCGAALDTEGTLVENPLDFGVFKTLEQEYELVLFDLGVISPDTEAPIRSPLFHSACVDSVVIIQDVRNTSREEVVRMKETIEAAGIRPAGLAENFALA